MARKRARKAAAAEPEWLVRVDYLRVLDGRAGVIEVVVRVGSETCRLYYHLSRLTPRTRARIARLLAAVANTLMRGAPDDTRAPEQTGTEGRPTRQPCLCSNPKCVERIREEQERK